MGAGDVFGGGELMPNKEQRKRMVEFIASQIEMAGIYDIVESSESHILAARRPSEIEPQRKIYVVAHNRQMTVDEFRDVYRQNLVNGYHTANVFYKDGETFMVRLGKRGRIKDERSLKNYPKEQIDSMIHLRKLEKIVLNVYGPDLVYYQPETERLEECLRMYEMQPVQLDYSHILKHDQRRGFVRDDVSKDYRIAAETGKITQGILFGFKKYEDKDKRAVILPLRT